MLAIGQEVFVLEGAATRHGVGAQPRSEHYGLDQRVMFGALLNSWALKAIDGRDADVVKNQLLHVVPGQNVVWLEE